MGYNDTGQTVILMMPDEVGGRATFNMSYETTRNGLLIISYELDEKLLCFHSWAIRSCVSRWASVALNVEAKSLIYTHV